MHQYTTWSSYLGGRLDRNYLVGPVGLLMRKDSPTVKCIGGQFLLLRLTSSRITRLPMKDAIIGGGIRRVIYRFSYLRH